MKEIDQLTTIMILGGMLKKTNKGVWRTTRYDEKADDIGPTGDRIRVDAADYMFKNNPGLLIIAAGRRGQLDKIKDVPTISSVIKKELIELNVPENKIIEESKSDNTYQGLQELKKIIKKRRLRRVGIISNEWHLPRIEAMINNDPEMKDLRDKRKIFLVSADKIVLENEPNKWKSIIRTAYKDKGLRKRIALEKAGIQQIKSGLYKFGNK